MNADLSHAHWAFVAPAYVLTAAVLGFAVVSTWLRLRRWERAAKADEEGVR